MKLNKIYNFLEANSMFNRAVQNGVYHACISPYNSTAEKAKSLLYHILNTQSQPNIDKVARFWQTILSDQNKLSSFTEFSNAIGIVKNTQSPYKNLFKALKKQPGWGDKTAALFVKTIYHVHKGQYKKYAFWKDVPELTKKDKLYLPVDTVIAYIFNKLSNGKIKSFVAINNELEKKELQNTKMDLWDDLWFWGFITQKGAGNKRKIEFNEAKYWAILHTEKDLPTITKIKNKANMFKKLIAAQ
jgi:hypothetical protein